jgi:hypothetical protein
MTESQKALSKLERKDKRRAIKGRPGADADLDWLTLNGLGPLVEAEVMQCSKAQVIGHHILCQLSGSVWNVTSYCH